MTGATLVMTLAAAGIGLTGIGYLARLTQGACGACAAFTTGAAMWMLGRALAAGLFRPGLVDGAELLIMMVALAVALTASRSLCAARPRRATGAKEA